MKEYENPEDDSVIWEKKFYCPIDNKYRRFYCVDGFLKFKKFQNYLRIILKAI